MRFILAFGISMMLAMLMLDEYAFVLAWLVVIFVAWVHLEA